MKFLILVLMLILSESCTYDRNGKAPVHPFEPDGATECALDRMIVQNFAGPKAQIHYQDGRVEFFCETEEIVSVMKQPGTGSQVLEIFVQDASQINWDHPVGGWVNAKEVYFVKESRKEGAMGSTLAPFFKKSEAEEFVKLYGGSIVRFSEL